MGDDEERRSSDNVVEEERLLPEEVYRLWAEACCPFCGGLGACVECDPETDWK